MHLVRVTRGLTEGPPTLLMAADLAWLAVAGLLLFLAPLLLFRRRVID
jgi:hypothetical protein